MIRKLVIYSILSSMMLHCASRLGFLDQLYQQRHQIAYTIGLITEIPIAMCSSDYNADRGLKIQVNQDESSLPSRFIQAQEINLFFKVTEVNITSAYWQMADVTWGVSFIKEYPSPYTSIFHPPSLV